MTRTVVGSPAASRRNTLRLRLAAVQAGGRKISSSAIEKALDRIMGQADAQRDGLVDMIAEVVRGGLVAAGGPTHRKALTPEDRKLMEQMGVDEETFRKHNPDYS